MAKIIARRDNEARYVYISSADNYPLPSDARDLLKRNAGDYSGVTQEWRVHVDRGATVVAALRISGHEVIAIDTADPVAPKPRVVGPPECKVCGHPYKSGTEPAGRTCVECGAELALVPPPGGGR